MKTWEKLKALIKLAPMTHAEIADAAGISARQVTRIVSGESVPSEDTVRALGRVFGLDPSAIMVENPSMLDMAMIAISSLDRQERDFIVRYLSELGTHSS